LPLRLLGLAREEFMAREKRRDDMKRIVFGAV